MVLAGVDKICFVISPGKSDILEYFGGSVGSVRLYYAVQPQPSGLCDAIPHHTSPPRQIQDYAEFCSRMTRRYAA